MPNILLKDILTKDVFTLHPYDKVDKMLNLMSEKKLSCCVVVDDENFPLGIFTQKDSLKLIASKIDITQTNINKVMSKPLLSAHSSLGFFEAYTLIYAKGYRHLVVVDDEGKLEGLATEYDFLTHLGLDFFVISKTAQEISKEDFPTLEYQQTVADILNIFEESQASCVLIVKNKKIQAIISEKEMLEFAKQKVAPDTKISALPLQKPFTTRTTTLLQDVVKEMRTHNRLQLIVLDEDEAIHGVIERHDIMSSFHGKAVELLIDSLSSKESTIHKLQTQKKELAIFMAAFETSTTAIVITNTEAIIQWANPAFARLTGYEITYALGKKPSELISSGLQSKEFYKILWECIEKGNPWQGIVTNKRKNGALYHEKLSITPLANSRGAVTNYIGFKEDITLEENLKSQLSASETRFRELFEQAPLPYQSLDTDGRILDINKKWSELLGYSEEEVKGKRFGDFLTQESLHHFALSFPIFLQSGHLQKQAFQFINKKNKQVSIEINGSIAYDEAHNPLHTHCILFDVSEQKAIIQERLEIESVFRTTNEGIMVTDKNQNITRVNQAFSYLTGYKEEEVIGRNPSFLSSGRHDALFYKELWQQIHKDGHWRGEIWNRKKSGEFYPELLNINEVRNSSGEIVNYIGVFSDITQQKLDEQQLEFLAHHDALTRLPNRLLLLSTLERSLKDYKRNKSMFALLLLDLDRFKNVNDSYGHMTGDELLQKIANRLSRRLRGVDLISRLGGDEFAILLPNILHTYDAGKIAAEIITMLTEPWILEENIHLQIGVSIGISILNEEINSSQEMLQYADVALYKAKNKGGNNFVYYVNEMTIETREKLQLENKLREAILNKELEIYLQPQIHIKTKKLIGAEALIRWNNLEQGLIYPDIFIPIAEESGLIRHIGSFVLQEACSLLAKWEEEGKKLISISINVSALQLKSDDFVHEVKSAIESFEINPKYLELELTESAIMNNSEESMKILHSLRSLGVKLVIDDFGTGYSSLSYLKKFPLDTLKVDKSFVNDTPYDRDDTAITKAIVEMGHILNFDIVAEGVETQEQLEFLQSIGCDIYQGYLESRPVSVSEFEKKYPLL